DGRDGGWGGTWGGSGGGWPSAGRGFASWERHLPLMELHVAALDPLAGERAQRREVGGEPAGGEDDGELARRDDADELVGGAHAGVGAGRSPDGGGGERQRK